MALSMGTFILHPKVKTEIEYRQPVPSPSSTDLEMNVNIPQRRIMDDQKARASIKSLQIGAH